MMTRASVSLVARDSAVIKMMTCAVRCERCGSGSGGDEQTHSPYWGLIRTDGPKKITPENSAVCMRSPPPLLLLEKERAGAAERAVRPLFSRRQKKY